jgi:hypothetical protein
LQPSLNAKKFYTKPAIAFGGRAEKSQSPERDEQEQFNSAIARNSPSKIIASGRREVMEEEPRISVRKAIHGIKPFKGSTKKKYND